MDFSQFLQELGVYGHLTALLLGMPRLFALVTVAPFLGSAVVTSQIRLLLVLALYLPLHPVIVSHLTDEITLSAALSLAVGGKLALLLLKEAVLGLMIGFLAGIRNNFFVLLRRIGFCFFENVFSLCGCRFNSSFCLFFLLNNSVYRLSCHKKHPHNMQKGTKPLQTAGSINFLFWKLYHKKNIMSSFFVAEEKSLQFFKNSADRPCSDYF